MAQLGSCRQEEDDYQQWLNKDQRGQRYLGEDHYVKLVEAFFARSNGDGVSKASAEG